MTDCIKKHQSDSIIPKYYNKEKDCFCTSYKECPDGHVQYSFGQYGEVIRSINYCQVCGKELEEIEIEL